MTRDQVLARLRDRFGAEFTQSLELEEGDRFIAVEDAGKFFASASARSRLDILAQMEAIANDREQPSNLVGYIDLDDSLDAPEIVLVDFVLRARDDGDTVLTDASDDDIRYEIERSQ